MNDVPNVNGLGKIPNGLEVWKIPGYKIDENFSPIYVREVREALSKNMLKEHIEKWDALLRFGQMDDEKIQSMTDCARTIVANLKCNCNAAKECPGVAVLVPRAAIIATMVASQLVVPEFTALHQIFCNSTDHSECA